MTRDALLHSRHFWAACLHLLNTVLLAGLIFGQDNSEGCKWVLCVLRGQIAGNEHVTPVWCANAGLCVWVVLIPAPSVIAETIMAFGSSDDWVGHPLRWIEYTFSAGLMTGVIATLSGETSILTIFLLLALNALLQWLGYVIERQQATQTDTKTTQFIAWAIFMVIWGFIFTQFGVSVRNAEKSIPNTVYAIPTVLFFLFLVFGINQTLWIAGVYDSVSWFGIESASDACDFGYTTLSYVSKTVLAWMCWGGVIREMSK